MPLKKASIQRMMNQDSIARIFRPALTCFLTLSFSNFAQAQQRDDPPDTQLQGEISTLKKDVKILGAGQQQIIGQLDELKQLLQATAAVRLGPQPPTLPSSLGIHNESFQGDSGATVAILEYSDFECPFCGLYERETSPRIFDSYIKTGKVKLFYRDLPLPMHPHAVQAARAARCAGEQGKYWEMHDSLFAKQSALSGPAILDRAQNLGMDTAKFTECVSSERYTEDIQKSMSEAQKMGIGGTPTFFIGAITSDGDVVNISKRIIGARPYADFQSALDELLASKSQNTVSTH